MFSLYRCTSHTLDISRCMEESWWYSWQVEMVVMERALCVLTIGCGWREVLCTKQVMVLCVSRRGGRRDIDYCWIAITRWGKPTLTTCSTTRGRGSICYGTPQSPLCEHTKHATGTTKGALVATEQTPRNQTTEAQALLPVLPKGICSTDLPEQSPANPHWRQTV